MSRLRPLYLSALHSIARWDETAGALVLYSVESEESRTLWKQGPGTVVRSIVTGFSDKLIAVVLKDQPPIVVHTSNGELVAGLPSLSAAVLSCSFSEMVGEENYFLGLLLLDGTVATVQLSARVEQQEKIFYARSTFHHQLNVPSADLLFSGPLLGVAVDDKLNMYRWTDLTVVFKDFALGMVPRALQWMLSAPCNVSETKCLDCVVLADVGSVALHVSNDAKTPAQAPTKKTLDFAALDSCVCDDRVLAFVEDGALKLFCGSVPTVIETLPAGSRLCGFHCSQGDDDGFYLWLENANAAKFVPIQEALFGLFIALEEESVTANEVVAKLNDTIGRNVSSRRRLARFVVTRDRLNASLVSSSLSELLECPPACKTRLQALNPTLLSSLSKLRDDFCFVLFEASSFVKPARGKFSVVSTEIVSSFFELFAAVEANTITQLGVFVSGVLAYIQTLLEDLLRESRQIRRSQAPSAKTESTPAIDPKDQTRLSEQLRALTRALEACYIDRSEVIRVSILAVLCKEHCFLLGPPGTAKSAVVRDICAAVSDEGKSSSVFEVVLHSGSTLDDVIGPYDLGALDDNVAIRTRTGKLAGDGTLFAFLDECFKAQKDLLTVLLSAMNERLYYDGTRQVSIPLHTMFGASNEIPKAADMGALLDRFLFRVMVPSVTESMKMWTVEFGKANVSTNGVNILTPNMLARIAKNVKDPPILLEQSKTLGSLILKVELFLKQLEVIKERVNTQTYVMGGGIWTDRRRKQMRKILNVSRFANDRTSIDPLDLLCLIPASWNDPSQIESVESFFINLLRDHRATLEGAARTESDRILDSHIFLSESLRTRLRAAESKPTTLLTLTTKERQQLRKLNAMNQLAQDELAVDDALGRESSRKVANSAGYQQQEVLGLGLTSHLPASFTTEKYLSLNTDVRLEIKGASERDTAVFAALHFYRKGYREGRPYMEPMPVPAEAFDSILPSSVDQWARHCVDLRASLTMYFRFAEPTAEWREGTAKGLMTIASVDPSYFGPAVAQIMDWLQNDYFVNVRPAWKQAYPASYILSAIAQNRASLIPSVRAAVTQSALEAVRTIAGKLPCAYCKEWFPATAESRTELLQHQETCQSRPYVCPNACGQPLSLKIGETSLIMAHQSTCPRFPLQCEGCKSSFPRLAFKQHTDQCPKIQVSCEYCTKPVPREALRTHLESVCEKRPVKCSYCGEFFQSDGLKRHQESDCSLAPVVCSVCQAPGIIRKTLPEHDKVCPMVLVECLSCKKQVRRKELPQHQDTCPEMTIECTNCKKPLQRKALNEHLQNTCEEQLIACAGCKTFTCKRKEMANHVCPELESKCSMCTVLVKNKAMQRHQDDCKNVVGRIDLCRAAALHTIKFIYRGDKVPPLLIEDSIKSPPNITVNVPAGQFLVKIEYEPTNWAYLGRSFQFFYSDGTKSVLYDTTQAPLKTGASKKILSCSDSEHITGMSFDNWGNNGFDIYDTNSRVTKGKRPVLQ